MSLSFIRFYFHGVLQCALQCVAVRHSVLQCLFAIVRCSVLQCVAVCYSALQCLLLCPLLHATTVLLCVAVCLQYVAGCCWVAIFHSYSLAHQHTCATTACRNNGLLCSWICIQPNQLQHTATHCNTLQRTCATTTCRNNGLICSWVCIQPHQLQHTATHCTTL